MDVRDLKNNATVRRWAWAVIDSVIWVSAIYAATWLRLDLEAEPVLVNSTLVFAVGAVAIHLVTGWTLGPYRQGHQRGSFEETAYVAVTVAVHRCRRCSAGPSWRPPTSSPAPSRSSLRR